MAVLRYYKSIKLLAALPRLFYMQTWASWITEMAETGGAGMPREEAILLSAYTGFLLAPDFSEVHKFCEDTLGRPIWTHEFVDSCVQKEIQEKLRPQIVELVQNIVALRPIGREKVERMRGEWQVCFEDWRKQIAGDQCSKCGFQHYGPSINHYKFCPNCGAPMTDEAVEMVMRRLEALYENRD